MERARGITIQSAAITFHWPPLPPEGSSSTRIEQEPAPRSMVPHTINLIDTPGHADFTFEVLRSLRILDGAVCILDGVAGVEAQTEKVWRQASTYKIPRIVYVNKLDRVGAAFGRTVKEIAERLMGYPAVCQLPWWEGAEGHFVGVGDVIGLKGLKWEEGGDGKKVNVFSLAELEEVNQTLAQEIKKARIALVELLSEHDDRIIEIFEQHEDHLAIPAREITESLRRCLIAGNERVIPVFAGASFKNMGVQPLLDAVVDLLPDPTERPDPEISIGSTRGGLNQFVDGELEVQQTLEAKKSKAIKSRAGAQPLSPMKGIEGCGLAFKVVNDVRRGVLVYIRVYSGQINRNMLLFNTNLHLSERPLRLLTMFASDAVEIQSIPAGQIGVIVGLKHARTGDTLISYAGANPKTGPPAPISELQLRPIEVPPPVFFASVEPLTLREEKHLSECLSLLLREDPSLQVSVDEDSGQTLLSGMGELHLEIARDRLVKDFKARAEVGNIEISYRECIEGASGTEHFLFDKDIAGKKGKAGCSAAVGPIAIDASGSSPSIQDGSGQSVYRDGNLISIVVIDPGTREGLSEDGPQSVSSQLAPKLHEALINGALAALARSPVRAYPLHGTHVTLSISPATDTFGVDTTPAALTSAARLATQAALRVATAARGTALMEPVMNVTISVDEDSLGAVVHDISSARGGSVVSLDAGSGPGPDSSNPDNLESSSSLSSSSLSSSSSPLPIVSLAKVYAPPDPFAGGGPADDGRYRSGPSSYRKPRSIVARVPLKEMIGYLKHLRSLTGGRGTFVMSVDKFEKMGRQRERSVSGELPRS
ncbi:MAG: Ribosome-releasing factor 2, mitochondrial [Sclerophora amabilis]|nr:MAG: Ribosome-releasing factor 2, mitochondrial [Sclerophora amabilis]